MNWEAFHLEARKRGFLLPGDNLGEDDLRLKPFYAPRDPRMLYELVKLVSAYAYPAKRPLVVREMRERRAKSADLANPEARTIVWHHQWRLPDGENETDYTTLWEYLKRNGYATS